MPSRPDGRANEQIQPLTIQFDGLSRADGSARFGFGSHPQALATVSGPIEARSATENPSAMTLEVHIRPVSGVPGTESKALASAVIASILPSLLVTQNPRTLVQLVIQILCSAPDNTRRNRLLASCINATTMALLNAGSIPMKGVVCAVCVGGYRSEDGSIVYVVDPSEREFKRLDASGCFAFMIASGRSATPKSVWSNWHSTTSDVEDVAKICSIAGTASQQVWLAMKNSLSPQSLPVDDDEAKMEI